MSLTRFFAYATLGCAAVPSVTSLASAIDKPDFHQHIKPILEAACVHCHTDKSDKGGLNLSTFDLAVKGGDNGTSLVPGKPSESPLYTTTILGEDEDEVMPPKKEGLLPPAQTELLKKWIEQGAAWPKDLKLEAKPRIDFVKHVKPILEQNCVSCHNTKTDKGGLDISSSEKAFNTGDNGPTLLPFNTKDSTFFQLTTLEEDDDDLMPPKKSGGPLKKEEQDILQAWIEQGAVWPEGVTLKAVEKAATGPSTPDDMELVKKIHAFIVQTSKEKAEADMKSYDTKGPKSGVDFKMVAIQGGEFLMGSPESEAGRNEDEGPQVKVQVKPFWMGEKEVTWDEYLPFMITDVGRNKDGSKQQRVPNDPISELTSQPTTPYTEMSFGMGNDGYPAISMTQHAANKFCQWLSAQTGHFYRLPTEQEWEYAARAGTTTAYYFGNDASKMGEYEWSYDNAPNFQYAQVGKKKPNPWGLYDMLGNVAEWTLDQYQADYYKNLQKLGPKATGFFVPSTTPYPHTVRGGSWDDDADRLRAAFRRSSNPDWKQQDPQLPKSIWYMTDATFLGFRIVRPLEIPTPEEMYKYWNNGVAKE